MIKRAKKAALEFFKDIFNKPAQAKKSKHKDKEDDGVKPDTPHHSHQVRKSLRNSLSDQTISSPSSKHKRKPSSQSKKKKHQAHSLPLPLNYDPAWVELRARSKSDLSSEAPILLLPKPIKTSSSSPSSSPTTNRKNKPHRVRSEISLKKSLEEGIEIERKSALKLLNNSKGITSGEPVHVSFEVYDKTPTPTPTPAQENTHVSDHILVPFMSLESLSEVKTADGENGESNKQERADRRKATSIISMKAENEKEAKVIEAYNKEIMDIWETMMARDVEEVNTRFATEKRELLAEIAFREAAQLFQGSDAAAHSPPRKDATKILSGTQNGSTSNLSKKSATTVVPPAVRRGSVVAFHAVVEIREVDHDGVARTTSKAALFDKDRPRPRPVKKAIRTSDELHSRVADNSNSPSNSSPLSSSPASPPISPRMSPTASPQPQSPLATSATKTASPVSSPLHSPNSSPRVPQRTTVNKPQPSPAKPKPPMRAFAKVLAGRPANSPIQDVTNPKLTSSRDSDTAMEEEIAQVTDRTNREKLALFEEIELREINAVRAQYDTTRRELLAEIAQRESLQLSDGAHKDSPRDGPRTNSFRVKRHAVRLRKTLTQALLDPVAQKAEDERIAREIREVNDLNAYKASEFTMRASAEFEMKRPRRSTPSYSHRQMVWRKSASFRLAIRQPAVRTSVAPHAGN